jgi:hypothetical protein
MNYVEMTTEEAIKLLRKSKGKKVLVAIKDLESDEEAIFHHKLKSDCEILIKEAKTVSSMCDDFVKQLKCFTEKQDIYDIKPKGVQKIMLLK